MSRLSHKRRARNLAELLTMVNPPREWSWLRPRWSLQPRDKNLAAWTAAESNRRRVYWQNHGPKR